MVDEMYGVRDPEAARAFHAEYDPLAKAQMLKDEELRNARVRALHEQGIGVTPSRLDTPERALSQAAFQRRSELLMEQHFGHGSGRDLFQFDTKAGRMSPTDPRSWIEHALNGTNEADHAAAIAKIRGRSGQIMAEATDARLRRLSNDELATALEQRWREMVGDAPVSDLPAQAAMPEPAAPTAPTAFDDLPDTFKSLLDEYRADILSADPDVSRAAARDAHALEKGVIPREYRKAWRDEVNRLRDLSGNPTGRSSRRGVSRIAANPEAEADQLFQATKNALGRAKRAIPTIDPAAEVREATSITINGQVRSDVKNADELLRRRNIGQYTDREVEQLLAPVEVEVTRNGQKVKETTNFWNRYQDNLETATRRRRTKLAREGFPTTEAGVTELKQMMDAEYDQALLQTIKDLTPKGRSQAAVTRYAKKIAGAPRSYLQFNVVTGPRAIFMDVVTNARLTTLAGEGGATRYVPGLMWDFVKDHLDEVDMIDHPLFSVVKESGIGHLPRDLAHDIGREEVSRAVTKKRSRLDPRNLGDSYLIKKVRGSNDNAFRHAIYLNKFNEELPREQAKFLDFVRGKVKAGKAPQDLFDETATLVRERFARGGSFTPEEIRKITRKFGTDDSYARTWAKQVDDLGVRANKAQQTVMFTYKKTKIDDTIGKVFLFHYYMTRSSALYVKLMLQHPQLIGLEKFIWDTSKDSLDKFEGAPPWLKGFVGFGLGDGHVLYSGALQLVTGLSAFQSIGDGGFSRSGIEERLNQTGLFLNPMWKSALAVLGWAGQNDPTGTTQLRKAVTSAIDMVRFSDWGREHGMDRWNGGLPTPDFVQDMVNGISEAINDQLREWGAPIRDFEEADSNSKRQQQIKSILISNSQEWEGTPEEIQTRLTAAEESLYTGQPNADVDAAVEEYVTLNAESSLANATPGVGPATVRDATTDARNQQEREAQAVDYRQRTPDQAAAVATNDLEQIRSAEATRLAAGMNAYNGAGTAPQQQIQAGKNQITQGYKDIPDWFVATIGGKTYTAKEIKQMDDAEREDLANTWAEEEMTKAGMASGARAAGPDYITADPNSALAVEKQQIKAEHPEIADYLDYRSWAYKQEDAGATQQTIQDMLAVGDTEFSRAYQRHRDYLVSQGVSGAELDAAMATWFRSEEAYAALMGWQWKDSARPGKPTFSINDPAPWREDVTAKDQAARDQAKAASDSAQLKGGAEIIGGAVRDVARNANRDRYLPPKKSSGSTQPSNFLREWLLVPGA
jgi:hypothetical protein